MQRWIIRHATVADGPPVRRMAFGILFDYGIPADPDDSDADIMDFGANTDARVHHLVAELDGSVVGSVIVAPMGADGGEAKLSRLFVRPTARRQGIGRALLGHAIAAAQAAGYRSLEINTRAVYREALTLYETTGWRRGADRPGPGPDRVYLYELTDA